MNIKCLIHFVRWSVINCTKDKHIDVKNLFSNKGLMFLFSHIFFYKTFQCYFLLLISINFNTIGLDVILAAIMNIHILIKLIKIILKILE